MLRLVNNAAGEALKQHGPLKSGPERWSRLVMEEWQEVEDELQTLAFLQRLPTDESRAIAEIEQQLLVELAQLVQLCQGVMTLVIMGKTQEEG